MRPVTLLDYKLVPKEIFGRIPSKGFLDRGIGAILAPIDAPVSMTYNVIFRDL